MGFGVPNFRQKPKTKRQRNDKKQRKKLAFPSSLGVSLAHRETKAASLVATTNQNAEWTQQEDTDEIKYQQKVFLLLIITAKIV